MKKLEIKEVRKFVNLNIKEFHKNKLLALKRIQLKTLLKKKNPYLFKAKNITTAQDLVKTLLDAFLSSQEETIFGDFLEKLAIYVCENVYDGSKSIAEGIDLELVKDEVKYIVAIKSGPNWGNSSQIKKMLDNFNKAKKVLRTSRSNLHLVAINGCCYGKDSNPDKGSYFKFCGQEFWEFISGNENLYIDIIEPLGFKAKQNNDQFNELYSQLINKLTYEFSTEYCKNGIIDWGKLVYFNSSKK